jgi:hypothetical protein
MKFYIASFVGEREYTQRVQNELRQRGHEITVDWTSFPGVPSAERNDRPDEVGQLRYAIWMGSRPRMSSSFSPVSAMGEPSTQSSALLSCLPFKGGDRRSTWLVTVPHTLYSSSTRALHECVPLRRYWRSWRWADNCYEPVLRPQAESLLSAAVGGAPKDFGPSTYAGDGRLCKG